MNSSSWFGTFPSTASWAIWSHCCAAFPDGSEQVTPAAGLLRAPAATKPKAIVRKAANRNRSRIDSSLSHGARRRVPYRDAAPTNRLPTILLARGSKYNTEAARRRMTCHAAGATAENGQKSRPPIGSAYVRVFALVELGDSESIDPFLREEDAKRAGPFHARLLTIQRWQCPTRSRERAASRTPTSRPSTRLA